jgi:hypothetical protein
MMESKVALDVDFRQRTVTDWQTTFISAFLLSLITCGIYGIYWWYTLITDPNLHFDNHTAWETQLSTALAGS